eukprot:g13889.t1
MSTSDGSGSDGSGAVAVYPAEFAAFLEDNGISSAAYFSSLQKSTSSLPRYVRLNPRSGHWKGRSCEEIAEELRKALVASAKGAEAGKASKRRRVEDDRNLALKPCSPADCPGSTDASDERTEVNENSDHARAATVVSPVSWLPGFFAVMSTVPGCQESIRLRGTKLYQDGDIYGCDAASGAAVRALLSGFEKCMFNNKGSDAEITALDLCCAPGTKLCILADELLAKTETKTSENCRSSRTSVAVVGVDVSRERLNACDSVVAKYFKQELHDENKNLTIRLECADGRSWRCGPKSGRGDAPTARFPRSFTSNIAGTKKGRKKAKRKAVEPVAVEPVTEGANDIDGMGGEVEGMERRERLLFDFVLVDAECSHDGSLRHVEKFSSPPICGGDNSDGAQTSSSWWPPDSMAEKMVWLKKTEELLALQGALLRNGFANLKVGGTLVYSTCSFSRRQNEDVVGAFLKENEELAEGVALFGEAENAVEGTMPCVYTSADRSMARFDPEKSGTSGLFLAKIRRKR